MSATFASAQPNARSGSPSLRAGSQQPSLNPFEPRLGAIRSIEILGPAGCLEAILNEGASEARFAAVVCHPHPLFGGTLHNKVVYHAMKALNDPSFGLGLPVLRFNFRGVGRSQGAHDGEAEVDDVQAAFEWLDRELQRPIVLAGFSFGAAMALRACCHSESSDRPAQRDRRVRGLIALGLPTRIESSAYHYSFLHGIRIPKLFVSGDRDQFSTPGGLDQVRATAAEPKQLTLIPGADHFFFGHLEPMQRAIVSWVKEQLQ